MGLQTFTFWYALIGKASPPAKVAFETIKAPPILDAAQVSQWLSWSVWGLAVINFIALGLFFLATVYPRIQHYVTAVRAGLPQLFKAMRSRLSRKHAEVAAEVEASVPETPSPVAASESAAAPATEQPAPAPAAEEASMPEVLPAAAPATEAASVSAEPDEATEVAATTTDPQPSATPSAEPAVVEAVVAEESVTEAASEPPMAEGLPQMDGSNADLKLTDFIDPDVLAKELAVQTNAEAPPMPGIDMLSADAPSQQAIEDVLASAVSAAEPPPDPSQPQEIDKNEQTTIQLTDLIDPDLLAKEIAAQAGDLDSTTSSAEKKISVELAALNTAQVSKPVVEAFEDITRIADAKNELPDPSALTPSPAVKPFKSDSKSDHVLPDPAFSGATEKISMGDQELSALAEAVASEMPSSDLTEELPIFDTSTIDDELAKLDTKETAGKGNI